MRNWFILFTTTFTISTLILGLTTWIFTEMQQFDIRYVVLMAISSALLSLFIHLFSKLPIENVMLSISLDIIVIFVIVFFTGIAIKLYAINWENILFVLVLTIVIYAIITIIYLFILIREAESMNGKIMNWRKKHVDRE